MNFDKPQPSTCGATPTPMPTRMNRRTGRYWSRLIWALVTAGSAGAAAGQLSCLVPSARLELAQLSPLPPQDSVSTNFTTTAVWNVSARGSEGLRYRVARAYPDNY